MLAINPDMNYSISMLSNSNIYDTYHHKNLNKYLRLMKDGIIEFFQSYSGYNI